MASHKDPSAPQSRRPRRYGVDPASGLDAEAVRAFLLDDPEFLAEDPEFAQLFLERLSALRGENVRSLHAAMLLRAQREAGELRDAYNDMITAAEDNLLAMRQTHRAVLALFEAGDLREVAIAVTERFRDILDIDASRLCIETGSSTDISRIHSGMIPVAPGMVDRLMAPATGRVLMRPARPETLSFHRANGGPVLSEALLRLEFGSDSVQGLLLFGAADPGRFSAEHGDELLGFLAEAISARLAMTPMA